MNIIGFLQNFNGVENGDLRRCIESMRMVSDEIYVYDDASTEDVWPIYQDFDCIVVRGAKNEFNMEIHHKDLLLRKLLGDHPRCDWICWFDSDAVLGDFFSDRERVNDALSEVKKNDLVQVYLHNLNLWRSENYYRIDLEYNDLWHCVFWMNTGQLHYNPTGGLHQKQFPVPYKRTDATQDIRVGAIRFQEDNQQLLHYGFADEERILRKYFTYKAHGQIGYPLDRLVTEKKRAWSDGHATQGMDLEPAKPEWFPEFCRPTGKGRKPKAILPGKVEDYDDYGACIEGELSHLQTSSGKG